MSIKILPVLLLFAVILSSCLLIPNDLNTAEKLLATNPDSALHILQKFKPTDFKTESDRALYGILLFQALDINNQPLQPDTVISFSLDYFQRVNDKPHLAYCYFYKGRIYKKVQRFDEATLLYLKTLDLIQNNEEFYYLLGQIYSDMGDISTIQQEYSKSLVKYQSSIEYFNLANDKTEACYKLIDIGRVYRILKDFKTAQIYFKKALLKSNNKYLHGSVYQEFGESYYSIKQYDSARFYLQKSLLFPSKGYNYAIRNYSLADLFFDINEFDSATYFANNSLKYPANFITHRECYRILANSSVSLGDLKGMAVYMSKYQDYSDSVRKIESQTKLSVIEKEFNSTHEVSQTKRNLKLIIGLAILLMIIAVIVVYILYKHNLAKKAQIKLVREQLTVNQHFVSHNLCKKIEDSRALQAKIRKSATSEERAQLDKELFEKCLHVSSWQAFSTEINLAYNQLITKLETAFPALSQKEIMFCCFQVLSLSHADKMLLLDSTSDGLYKLKQRLSLKLNLNSAKELDSFLQNLVSLPK